MSEKQCALSKMIENYKYTAPGNSSKTIDFENIDDSNILPGDCIYGKAWLSSRIYTSTPESYTPFRPLFKGHIETKGIAGISWVLNYMPACKIHLNHGDFRLAFLYPYKSPGFNIKLCFKNIPVETYNQYMSIMYSKEEISPKDFSMEDIDFKPFPVLIPKDMETETIVDFKGTLSLFEVNRDEILSLLNTAAKLNYSSFIRDKIFCLSLERNDTCISTLKFKDFKNSRYNVKYGSIIKEFKFKGEKELPGFIPDIPHALCGTIGDINEAYKSPAFSSTPNYSLNKAKAISSCCGPVLFNYASGNIISISVFYNLNDRNQHEKMEDILADFETILKKQLQEYIKTNFKFDIVFSEV